MAEALRLKCQQNIVSRNLNHGTSATAQWAFHKAATYMKMGRDEWLGTRRFVTCAERADAAMAPRIRRPRSVHRCCRRTLIVVCFFGCVWRATRG
eukprot:6210867-Pleurochrysis_carterae.AAC.1